MWTDSGGNDSADNLVLACETYNSSRGDKGIFEWLGLKKKDKLHRLVAGKYLKQLLQIHQAEETYNITRQDIDNLCKRCPLPEHRSSWGTVKQLTCFCLENVLPYNS